jgi:hypothetical protein
MAFGFNDSQGYPFFVVRAKGLEPPHLAMPEPKSGASTNSATPAYEKLPFNKRREPLTGKPLRGKGRSGETTAPLRRQFTPEPFSANH